MINRKNNIVFAIIGAGNGGCAMAAHLSILGFKVNLYNRSEDKLKDIKENGGIELKGAIKGFGVLNKITSDIEDAIRDTDIIMITTPATGHRDIATLAAPFLREGQTIVLNPGRTGGALEFRNVLRRKGVRKDVVIAEAQTFIYACRLEEPALVKVFSVKNKVDIAAIPAYKTRKVVKMLNKAYPQFCGAKNILETSLNNIGAVFHPAPTILNSARIETTGGNFEYYIEGISPSVAKVVENIDNERLKVAKALGVAVDSALEWLRYTYGVQGENLYEAIQNTKAYKGIGAPGNLNVRYIFEDVPESLVPIASFGELVGIPTPTIGSIIEMASVMHDIDYWEVGRTVDKLGLKGLNLSQIYQLVQEGSVLFPEDISDNDISIYEDDDVIAI